MANKEVIINGKKMMYGTSAKASPETNTSSTSTFDGVVNEGLDEVPWSLEFSKLRYEGLTSHREMSETLDKMISTPAMVTIRETVITPDESYTIVDNYFNCLVNGNDYEVKPDEKTVENIKIKASRRERKYE
ncbi:hypothetical protein [uncultured Methanobrevibacter sp.]|uniref:hypothetical protein n=1 Tax=uncultured Methanobrevibacter sp. TaxID=253161 RepID=UPI0025F85089|nr:hypothetical protein [uncultured Methanobrevibacter sp.]